MTKLTKPKTIVCFGDSNTHGYNSSNDGRHTETGTLDLSCWTPISATNTGS